MKKTLLIMLPLFLAGCAFLFPHKEKIVIGGIVAMTGEMSEYGNLQRQAVDLRINQINKQGGVNGRELEIIWRDGYCKKEIAAQQTEELIKKERVKIILGGTCSEETLGIAEVANINRVLAVAAAGQSPIVAGSGDFIFRTMPSNAGESELLAEYLRDRSIASVGTLREEKEDSKSLQHSLDINYLGIIWEEPFVPGITEVRSTLEALIGREIGVFFLNLQSDLYLDQILSELQDLKFDGVIWVNQATLEALKDETYLDSLKYFKAVIGANYYNEYSNGKLAEFIRSFEEQSGEPIVHVDYVISATDAIDVLSNVLSVVDDVANTNELLAAMNIVQHLGLSGPIIFDIDGEITRDHALFQFSKDKFIPFSE